MSSVHGRTVFGGTFPAEIWHSLYTGGGRALRGIRGAEPADQLGPVLRALRAVEPERRGQPGGGGGGGGEGDEPPPPGSAAVGGYDPDAYAPGRGRNRTPPPPPRPRRRRRRRERGQVAAIDPGLAFALMWAGFAATSGSSPWRRGSGGGSSGGRSSSSSPPSRSPRSSSPTTSTATSTTPGSASATGSTPTSTRRSRCRRPRLRRGHLDRSDQRLRAALHPGDLPARLAPGRRRRRRR